LDREGGGLTSSATRIRGTHISWDRTEDIPDCHFVLVHFVFPFGAGDVAEIGVGPGVGGYLMTFVVHTSRTVSIQVN
jgi:hypothetical protein